MRPEHPPTRQQKVLAAVVVTSHRALAHSMSALGAAHDDDVVPCYHRLVAAAEQAFRAEERAAEHINHRAVREQRERHARVLLGLHQASARVQDGDLALARDALELLSRFLLLNRPSHEVALAATNICSGRANHAMRPGRLVRAHRQWPLLRVPRD
jgi:hemerythrin